MSSRARKEEEEEEGKKNEERRTKKKKMKMSRQPEYIHTYIHTYIYMHTYLHIHAYTIHAFMPCHASHPHMHRQEACIYIHPHERLHAYMDMICKNIYKNK